MPVGRRAELKHSGETFDGLMTLNEARTCGGGREASDASVRGYRWLGGVEQRRSPRRRLLSVCRLSCRMRRTSRRRVAAAPCGTCRSNPGRRCSWGRSAARNTNEPWRARQPGGSALAVGLTCICGASPLDTECTAARLRPQQGRVLSPRTPPQRDRSQPERSWRGRAASSPSSGSFVWTSASAPPRPSAHFG
jgi:hypothetical protein